MLATSRSNAGWAAASEAAMAVLEAYEAQAQAELDNQRNADPADSSSSSSSMGDEHGVNHVDADSVRLTTCTLDSKMQDQLWKHSGGMSHGRRLVCADTIQVQITMLWLWRCRPALPGQGQRTTTLSSCRPAIRPRQVCSRDPIQKQCECKMQQAHQAA